MKIVLIITIALLFLVLLLCKKSNTRKDIIISSIFNINIIYFFNLFLTFILSIFHIPANSITLIIFNLLVIGIIIFYIIRKYGKFEIQKYKFNFKEFLSICIIFGICIGIGILRFDKFKQISYETTDPAAHYKMADVYSHNLNLLDKNNSKDYVYNSFSHTMPGFYVNCGFFMYLFNSIQSYKIYLMFDIFILFLLSATFYITILKIKKNMSNNFLILVISLLYLGAYALNNLIFGFGYLGVGILATNFIILNWLFIDEEKKDVIQKKYYILLFIANFGLFFSYYLFVPVIYLSQGLYIIYNFIKKNYSLKHSIFIGTITLIIPFIMGMLYFILPGFFQANSTGLGTAYAQEGYIYRDLWSNFILIFPILIFSLIYFIKKKKIDLITIIFVTLLLFIICTFCLGLFMGKVSSYYYFKSYYIFYLIIYLMIVRLVNVKETNVQLIFKINMYFILFIVFILLMDFESKIQKKNILFNNANITPVIANIYWFNSSKIVHNDSIINALEMKLVFKAEKYKDKCLNDKKEFFVVGDVLQKLWFYVLTDMVPINNFKRNQISMFYEPNNVESFENDPNSRCVLIFNSSNNKEDDSYIDDKNYRILYKNDYGKILMKKKY